MADNADKYSPEEASWFRLPDYVKNNTTPLVLPTSPDGLPSGSLWNNAGSVAIVP